MDVGSLTILFTSVLVGNGHHTMFWIDCWITDPNLKTIFFILYWLVMDKDCTVASFLKKDRWSQNFINLSHPAAQSIQVHHH